MAPSPLVARGAAATAARGIPLLRRMLHSGGRRRPRPVPPAAAAVLALAGCGCVALLDAGAGDDRTRPPAATAAASTTGQPPKVPKQQQPQQQQPQAPAMQQSPPPGPGLRRRYSTRRPAGGGDGGEAEAWAAEWTPEGGGNTPMLRRRGTAVARRATQSTQQQGGSDGAGQQPQSQPPRRMRRRRTAAAVLAEGGEEGGEEEEEDDDYHPATTAARVLRELQAWETRPPGPCDKYNSLTTRFLGWQTRRRECNAAPGCAFVGRSMTGFCVGEEEVDGEGEDEDEEDDWSYYYDEEDEKADEFLREFPSSSDPEGPMVETELLASLVTTIRQEGIEQPVRLLITGSLAEAMTDSLKQGQTGTLALAKELVMEVLAEPETAQALPHVLGNAEVRASTRRLVHSLAALPYTEEQAHKLLKAQLDYLLVRNRWTEESLATTFDKLLRMQTTHGAMVPLLSWALSPEGPVLAPTAAVTTRLVPLLGEGTVRGLKSSVRYALESEQVQSLAKESVRGMLLSKIAAMEAAQRARDAAARAAMMRREKGEEREEEGEEGQGGEASAAVVPSAKEGEREEEEQEAQQQQQPPPLPPPMQAKGREKEVLDAWKRARESVFDKADPH